MSRKAPAESWDAANRLATDPAIQFVRHDVRTLPDLGRFAFVIHAAAPASAQAHAADPQGTLGTIVEGTRRVLELASEAGTKRLLFLSSGAVYGRQPPELERLSETSPFQPDPRPYAEGKRAAEQLCVQSAREGFAPVIARGFAFVGPGLPLDGPFAIGCFIRDALKGGPIRIEGDGTPLRSYLYASDLAAWLWTMLFKGKPAHPYNVGGEQAISIAELAKTVARVLAPGARIEITGKTTGAKPERYVPSTARAREELGLTETVSLEEAIRRTAG